MKNFFIIFLFTSMSNYSQTDIYDYIINKKNDTIVGMYKYNEFIDLNKKNHTLTTYNIKTIKHKDIIYKLDTTIKKSKDLKKNDSVIFLSIIEKSNNLIAKKKEFIFTHKLNNGLQNDFIINNQKDTIYGQITEYDQLVDSLGKKTNIRIKNVIEYRKDGYHYYNKKKRRVNPFESKRGFLKLLIKGDANLYEYAFFTKSARSGMGTMDNSLMPMHMSMSVSGGYSYYYFIERKNNFDLINSHRFYQIMKRLLPENEQILEKIKKKVFDIDDIYFIVKYYNKSMK